VAIDPSPPPVARREQNVDSEDLDRVFRRPRVRKQQQEDQAGSRSATAPRPVHRRPARDRARRSASICTNDVAGPLPA
jgi:hypothetical protein